MDNTFAIDILDAVPTLALTEYNHVRIYCGSDWVDLSVRNGKPTIMANRGFLIRPVVANSITIEFD
jgi:hypothetical protein